MAEHTIDAGAGSRSLQRRGGGARRRPAARCDGVAPLRRDGLQRRAARRAPRRRLRRARPRRLVAAPTPEAYGYEGAGRRPARGARRARDRARRPGRRLDGGAHVPALRARAARAGRRRSPRSRRPIDPVAFRAASGSCAGTRSATPCATTGSTASRRSSACSGSPSSGARRSGARCASGWRSTSTSTRSPTRCSAVPRSAPFEDLHALEQIECPALVDRLARRGRSGPPARGRRALRRAAAARPPCRRGGRRVTARLAGRTGREADRRDRAGGPVSAGYSGTPLVRKLGFKPGMRVALRRRARAVRAARRRAARRRAVLRRAGGELDLAMLFVTSRARSRAGWRRLQPSSCPRG